MDVTLPMLIYDSRNGAAIADFDNEGLLKRTIGEGLNLCVSTETTVLCARSMLAKNQLPKFNVVFRDINGDIMMEVGEAGSLSHYPSEFCDRSEVYLNTLINAEMVYANGEEFVEFQHEILCTTCSSAIQEQTPLTDGVGFEGDDINLDDD